MRKEKIITITNGRDAGKKFRIREMGALQTERWATKVLMLMVGSRVDLGLKPEELKGVEGWQNIAKAGLTRISELDYDQISPLLEDLLNCCSFMADTNIETQLTSSNVETIIEDMATLFKLRKEAFGLHFDFFQQEPNAK